MRQRKRQRWREKRGQREGYLETGHSWAEQTSTASLLSLTQDTGPSCSVPPTCVFSKACSCPFHPPALTHVQLVHWHILTLVCLLEYQWACSSTFPITFNMTWVIHPTAEETFFFCQWLSDDPSETCLKLDTFSDLCLSLWNFINSYIVVFPRLGMFLFLLSSADPWVRKPISIFWFLLMKIDHMP